MSERNELKELTRAISFARQNLNCAFYAFVSGDTQSVSSSDDIRNAREALLLIEYLATLSRILLPLNGILPELLDTCLPWTEYKKGTLKGEASRKTLEKTLKAVERIEAKLTKHLAKGPPFAPSSFVLNVMPSSEKVSSTDKEPD